MRTVELAFSQIARHADSHIVAWCCRRRHESTPADPPLPRQTEQLQRELAAKLSTRQTALKQSDSFILSAVDAELQQLNA